MAAPFNLHDGKAVADRLGVLLDNDPIGDPEHFERGLLSALISVRNGHCHLAELDILACLERVYRTERVN